ncbi:MAG: UDP-N-acetylmuramoyl-tripeptide--D-alanyl-D-alanine ligase [Myxococcaceae bacterium]|nr:UDP-N-acetylmuramoyl-tripeptide--D-alanyl-D-alanine ligase [Myxococcaceae bacterium]MCI0671951.1 UDP-N-acetylmuramoyl-tripeptide--D-alanyl-D-alanine ligase [Myxococcaceae bacterium]
MTVTFTPAELLEATSGQLLGDAPSVLTGVSTDTRTLVPGSLFVALVGEKYDAHRFLAEAAVRGAALAVVQRGRERPGAPAGLPLLEVGDTLVALGALGRLHRRRFRIPVGAVTGSNGKTSTKEMVAAILGTRGPALKTHGNLNNEVGVPLTLFGLAPEHRSAIVEMGMNHLGEIDRLTRIAEPDAGLVTVVQPVHTEGVGGIDGVARAKGELFHALSQGGTAVVNLDDARIVAQAATSGRRQLTFGTDARADVRLLSAEPRAADGQQVRLSFHGVEHAFLLGFLGAHNAMNAAGAAALALALGFTPEECLAGLTAARPWAGRLNLKQGLHGVQVLDDCYNANPGSMAAGLTTLKGLAGEGRAVVVLGDMLELGEEEAHAHEELGLKAAGVARVAAFFGPRSAAGAAAARRTLGTDAAHFTDVDALLDWLTPRLTAGDTVLVKASRGMRLERVVAGLTGTAAATGSH